jgi:hypothetical protein
MADKPNGGKKARHNQHQRQHHHQLHIIESNNQSIVIVIPNDAPICPFLQPERWLPCASPLSCCDVPALQRRWPL